MANREDMLALIKAASAARDGAETDSLITAFHPEGAFTVMGDKSALELAGSMQGHPTLHSAFTQLTVGLGFEGRKIPAELVDGDRVAVHSRVSVQYQPTGKTVSTEILDLFRF